MTEKQPSDEKPISLLIEEMIEKGTQFDQRVAITLLEMGYSVARKAWAFHDKGMFLFSFPIHIKTRTPYDKDKDENDCSVNTIYSVDLQSGSGKRVPWTTTDEDLVATDYYIVKKE